MNVTVIDSKGKKTSKKVELADSIFAIEPNDHAIWLDVRSIRANQRQGTHDTKGRSDVSGGGRKPFRQKGTGRARQGTSRAPQHTGGGRVFGPHPRTYSVGIPKKVKALARRSALAYKAREEKIVVVEDFSYEKPQTRSMKDLLEALNTSGKSVLVLTSSYEPNIYKSAKNLYGVEVRESITFSTYDVMKANTVIFQKGALEKVNEVLGK